MIQYRVLVLEGLPWYCCVLTRVVCRGSWLQLYHGIAILTYAILQSIAVERRAVNTGYSCDLIQLYIVSASRSLQTLETSDDETGPPDRAQRGVQMRCL